MLGPALIPTQKCFHPKETINPSFELAYWHWGLRTAQEWRKRLSLPEDTLWQRVIDKLSALPVMDNRYLFAESAPQSWTDTALMTDHPMVLAMRGFLPASAWVDVEIMENTLMEVRDNWQWETCWGWDFPMAAMCASSLGKDELAFDFLLMESSKNRYLANGHNYQDKILRLYLPGNGALLTAIATICNQGVSPSRSGIYSSGPWHIRYENLRGIH